MDDQTLDRQVDFAELGVIHNMTVAAIADDPPRTGMKVLA
jgi:hypothetical protein